MAKKYSRQWAQQRLSGQTEQAGQNFALMSDTNLRSFVQAELSRWQMFNGATVPTEQNAPDLVRAMQEADRRGVQYR